MIKYICVCIASEISLSPGIWINYIRVQLLIEKLAYLRYKDKLYLSTGLGISLSPGIRMNYICLQVQELAYL